VNKEILEMMGKLNENIEKGFAEINGRIDKTNKHLDETNKRIDETNEVMNARFDNVDTRLDKIDGRIYGLASHFEELSKNTLAVRDDLNQEVKYLQHKVNHIEKELFFLNPEQ